jgi:cell division protein FtsW (lipid II flippase)
VQPDGRDQSNDRRKTMLSKILFGVIGVVLMAVFLLPVVFKLKEISLGVVIVLGLALMIIDMVQSLRSND